MASVLRQRWVLGRSTRLGRLLMPRTGSEVQEAVDSRVVTRYATGARSFNHAAAQNIWDRHIHIPDIPVWVLVTSGAGAGGLLYYYRFFKKGHHAHAEPFTGQGHRRDYKGAANLPVEAVVVETPAVPLPQFQATDVASGTAVTPDDLEGTAVLLVFVDPTEPLAMDGLTRLQDVTEHAGKGGRMGLQPVALDMTSGGKQDLAQLLAKLEGSRKKGPGGEPGMPPIRGLIGEEAAGKIKDSVQRFAESPVVKSAAVKVDDVTEEGVIHLFGPDGMLIIQYDATLLPQGVAEDIVSRMQKYEQQGKEQDAQAVNKRHEN